MLRRALMALTVTACAACGQVGPLRLPDDAPDNEGYLLQRKKGTPPPAAAPAPAAAPEAPSATSPSAPQ